MKNTDIVIAYISPDMESELREKIAEILRMRQIQTTDDIKTATVVIHTTQQIPGPGMTLAELAEKIIGEPKTEIFHLREHLAIPPVVNEQPVIQPNKRKNFDVKHALRQYNRTKQGHNRNLFNRIKHK